MEPISLQNPRFQASINKWDLSNSPRTSVTESGLISSGPWSISPKGNLLSCLATKTVSEQVEDLFLAKCDPEHSVCVSSNLVGRFTAYRRMYPRGCPFSPDGSTVASLRDIKGVSSLVIASAKTAKVLAFTSVSKPCKGLRGVVANCQFSPDSHFLAVTSSYGQVYILRRSGLKLYQYLRTEEVVFVNGTPPDLPAAEADNSVTPCTFDFDPRSRHHVFATCSFSTGLVRIWRVNSDEQRDIHCKQSLTLRRTLNIIKYSPDGRLLALGAHDASISFIDPDEGSTLFVLKTRDQQPEFQSEAGIFHIAFSLSGEHLAASYSDGFIRVWQLPVKFDLQHLCRIVINTCISPRNVQRLCLPGRLKKYLLFENF